MIILHKNYTQGVFKFKVRYYKFVMPYEENFQHKNLKFFIQLDYSIELKTCVLYIVVF